MHTTPQSHVTTSDDRYMQKLISPSRDFLGRKFSGCGVTISALSRDALV